MLAEAPRADRISVNAMCPGWVRTDMGGPGASRSVGEGADTAVRLADEAVCIGPPPARESYLAMDNIFAACKQTGAEAVHPGYGFLSEQPEFARACATAGYTFVGPDAAALEQFGNKSSARRAAIAAGVPAWRAPLSQWHQAVRGQPVVFPCRVNEQGQRGGDLAPIGGGEPGHDPG